MATLNLVRIKPVFQGAYNAGTSYVVDDIVTFQGETFINILASTGVATSNATNWPLCTVKLLRLPLRLNTFFSLKNLYMSIT